MKIGIFGGAFDPLHSEHQKIIETSISELKTDKMILVPSANPPHKNGISASFEDRVNMLRLWINGRKNIEIDCIENEFQPQVSYAYTIVAKLKEKYVDDDLIYFIGGDSMVNFHTWVHPEIIAKLVPIAVYPREGCFGLDEAIARAEKDYSARIFKLKTVGKQISSSEIKARLELDLSVDGLISQETEQYIKSHGLYSENKPIIDKLRANIPEELFEHCARTALYALRYATILGVSYRSAFLGGLLHDAAKIKAHTADINAYPTTSRAVIHQYMGRAVAKEEYGIEDEDILSAIEYHTTGKPDMTPLQKLIYVADKLEDGRDFEGISKLRATVEKDFYKGFDELVLHTQTYLKSKGETVDDLTNACAEYIINTNKL